MLELLPIQVAKRREGRQCGGTQKNQIEEVEIDVRDHHVVEKKHGRSMHQGLGLDTRDRRRSEGQEKNQPLRIHYPSHTSQDGQYRATERGNVREKRL